MRHTEMEAEDVWESSAFWFEWRFERMWWWKRDMEGAPAPKDAYRARGEGTVWLGSVGTCLGNLVNMGATLRCGCSVPLNPGADRKWVPRDLWLSLSR